MHAFDRRTDGRTDRQTDRPTHRIPITRQRLHSMQRGKKVASNNDILAVFCLYTLQMRLLQCFSTYQLQQAKFAFFTTKIPRHCRIWISEYLSVCPPYGAYNSPCSPRYIPPIYRTIWTASCLPRSVYVTYYRSVIGCNTATSQEVESQIDIKWSSSFNLCGLVIRFKRLCEWASDRAMRRHEGEAYPASPWPCCDVVAQATVVINADGTRSIWILSAWCTAHSQQ